MTLDQFIRCLDTYGADFRRWPGRERADGERLRDALPDARRRWEAARRLDELFALDRASAADRVREVAITDAALRRIRAAPRKSVDWRWLFARPMGAALGATLAAGLIAGFYAGPVLHPSSQDVGPLAVTALLDGEEDLL